MTIDISDFYGDNFRWFVGVVVNNRDPEERGRLQIRIHGIHGVDLTAVPDHTLPWAETMLPSTEGGVSGIGRIPQILNSALVFGVFLDGIRSQTPLVLGSLTHQEGPSSTQRVLAGSRGESQLYSSTAIGNDGTVINPQTRSALRDNSSINERRIIVMRFFIENGFTAVQAAGITGNLEAESSLRSDGPVGGVGEQGIAQWNPQVGRLQKLQRFANRNNVDYTDFWIQLQFIIHELRGRSINNDGGSEFAHVYNKLQRCNDFEGGVSDRNSTWIFCRYYEIPADPEAKLLDPVNGRQVLARRAMEAWTNAVNNSNPYQTGTS